MKKLIQSVKLLFYNISINIFDLIYMIFPSPAFYLPSLVLAKDSSQEGDPMDIDSSSNEGDPMEEDSEEYSSDEESVDDSNQPPENRLDSILSDYTRLINAKDLSNKDNQRNALRELEEKHPKELKGTESVEEFIDNVEKKLDSKFTDIQNEVKNFLNEKEEPKDSEQIEDPNEVTDEIRKTIAKNNPELTEAEIEKMIELINEKDEKKDNDDDDDDSKGGGPSSSGGNSSSGGPSTEGPSAGSSSHSKVSSNIDYVLEKASCEITSTLDMIGDD